MLNLAVSDLELAIAGLAQFDRRCPPNICLLGHFGTASIRSYWLAISLRFLSFGKHCVIKFHRIDKIKNGMRFMNVYYIYGFQSVSWDSWEQVELSS